MDIATSGAASATIASTCDASQVQLTGVPQKCGPLCGVGQYSKNGMRKAIVAGDLTGDGRCPYCYGLARIVKCAPPQAKGSKRQAPAQQGEPKKVVRRKQPSRRERRTKKVQVLSLGAIELVYPTYVAPNVVPKLGRLAPHRKFIVPDGCSSVPIKMAPSWMLPKASRVAPRKVATSLTPREEFALLKKRLLAKGKRLMREGKARRLMRQRKRAAKEAAREASREQVRQAERLGELRLLMVALGHGSAGNSAATPTHSVLRQWAAQEQRQALLCQDLAEKKALRKIGQKECPHVRARVVLPPKIAVPKCPWDNVGYTVQSLRGVVPKDGTMGACNYAHIRLRREVSRGLVPLQSAPIEVQSVVRSEDTPSTVKSVAVGVSLLPQIDVPQSIPCENRLDSPVGEPQLTTFAPSEPESVSSENTLLEYESFLERSTPIYNNFADSATMQWHGHFKRRMKFYYLFWQWSNERDVYPNEKMEIGTLFDDAPGCIEYEQWSERQLAPQYGWFPRPIGELQAAIRLSTCRSYEQSAHPDEVMEIGALFDEAPGCVEYERWCERQLAPSYGIFPRARKDKLSTHWKCDRRAHPDEVMEIGALLDEAPGCTEYERWCERQLAPSYGLFPRARKGKLSTCQDYENLTRFELEPFKWPQTCKWCESGKRVGRKLMIEACECWSPAKLVTHATLHAAPFYKTNVQRRVDRWTPYNQYERSICWEILSLHDNGAKYWFAKAEEPKIENSSFSLPLVSSLWSRVVRRPPPPEEAPIAVSRVSLQSSHVSELQERMEDREANNSVGSISDLIETLEKRKAPVAGAGENRVADKQKLTESMIFHQPGFIKRLRSRGEKTYICANLNSDKQVVRMGKAGTPVFTPLPRMTEEQLRKMSEKGIGSTSSVALDIGIQSHIPQGMPTVAFINVMDTRVERPEYAALCGSYVDLGRDRAKTLCLPLANFPLNEALADSDDVLHGLVMATYFQDPTGFSVGKPAFQYGTLEFQEYKPSAYSDFSRVRDRWDQIVKTQDTPGDRIVAGFSVLASVSQEYNQAFPEFEPITLQCPPRRKPAVTTYRNPERFDIIQRRKSFRMPATGFGSCSTGVWSQVVDRGHTPANAMARGEQSPPRGSFSLQSGIVPPMQWHATSSFAVEKDAKGGAILLKAKLRDLVRQMDNPAWIQWVRSRTWLPTVKGEIRMGSSLMSGLAFGLVCDAFNRLNDEKLTTMLSEVANCLPLHVFPLSNPTLRSFEFKLGDIVGFPQHYKEDNFADVTFFLYVISTNSAPANANWRGTILWKFEEDSNIISTVLPMQVGTTIPLDCWKGPTEFAQGGTRTGNAYTLNFANLRRASVLQSPFTAFNLAKLAMYSGYRGTIRGRIVKTGPAMVSADLFLTMLWGDDVSLTDAILAGGQELIGGEGEFALTTNSTRMAHSAYEDSTRLYVILTCGVIAPKDLAAPFQYMTYFDSIEFDATIPPIVNTTMEFLWCTVDTITTDVTELYLPARLADIVSKGANVVMAHHPLALMVMSSGMMKGRLTLRLDWCYVQPLNEMVGSIAMTSKFGRHDNVVAVRQQKATALAPDATLAMTLSVDDMGTFISSRGRDSHENYCHVEIAGAKSLTRLAITVILEPGFELRGRSLTPIKVGTAKDSAKVSPLMIDKGEIATIS
uniref:Polyprotein n=1 Tax=Pearl millet nepovirus TaxID=3115773 RepID=A0AAT9J7V7_9SECO